MELRMMGLRLKAVQAILRAKVQYLAIALETKGKLSRNEHSAYGVARRMAVQASP